MAVITRGRSVKKPRSVIAKKPRGIRRRDYTISRNDYLASRSEFGGTYDERLADGAAHEIGRRFDDAQVYISLDLWFEKTIADRFIRPNRVVFIDGPQHTLRPETAQGDMMKRLQLIARGYIVYNLDWADLRRDPEGTVMQCWI